MGEVYFGAGDIPAEAIGRTDSNGWSKGQQNVHDFDSILFLYAPRKGLHSIGDLQHCVNCEYVWLAGNQLERIHKYVRTFQNACGSALCMQVLNHRNLVCVMGACLHRDLSNL